MLHTNILILSFLCMSLSTQAMFLSNPQEFKKIKRALAATAMCLGMGMLTVIEVALLSSFAMKAHDVCNTQTASYDQNSCDLNRTQFRLITSPTLICGGFTCLMASQAKKMWHDVGHATRYSV